MSDLTAPAQQPSFYFDMDGVLCAYNYSDYRTPKSGGLPPYLRHGAHLFLNMPENPNIMQAFCMLYGLLPPGTCRVLTRIPVGVTQAEHTIDKFNWMCRRLSTFRQSDFLCVSVPKHDAVGDPLFGIGRNAILIDDWNPNLADWAAHGGTAVKCLNGINSKNPAFRDINAGWRPGDIMNELLRISQASS